MKRRAFLQSAAVAGGIVLASDVLGAPVPTKKPKSVIVIGAGFSGLAAAYRLKKAGVEVTVLESRNRISGRVFSFQPESAPGQVIELGAEWVGNSHERVLELCKEFGLELFNNQFSSHLTYQGEYSKAGEWKMSPEMEEFWSKKEEIWETYTEARKKKLDKMDWWRFLSQKGFTDRDLDIRDLLDSTDFGESNRHVSACTAFAEFAESSEYNEMDQKIKGGNGQLAEKLADAIGREKILLQHKVVSITQGTTTGVTVVCDNGAKFTASKLICSAPTFSVMKINWTPALPAIQTDAMQSLQYARIGKFPIVFTERFWGAEDFDMVTDEPGHYFYHATKSQPGPHGILVSYATGDKADVLASVKQERRVQLILDSLKPAFGDVSKYVKDSIKYYWGKDQYSYGAYAMYGIGQWYEVMPILKKPYLHTHFSGEHVADWQGFMEGAIVSGEDAADAIMGV